MEYDTYQEFFFKEALKWLNVEGSGRIYDDGQINLVGKFSNREWVRSVFKEFCDYGKLSDVGQGEIEVHGLKIQIESGEWRDKKYFSLRMVDVGQTLRVYRDNTISFWYAGDWYNLDLDSPGLKVHNTELTTILTRATSMSPDSLRC